MLRTAPDRETFGARTATSVLIGGFADKDRHLLFVHSPWTFNSIRTTFGEVRGRPTGRDHGSFCRNYFAITPGSFDLNDWSST